jgi:hypothetical protein
LSLTVDAAFYWKTVREKVLQGLRLTVWDRVRLASRMSAALLAGGPVEAWWDFADAETIDLAAKIVAVVSVEFATVKAEGADLQDLVPTADGQLSAAARARSEEALLFVQRTWPIDSHREFCPTCRRLPCPSCGGTKDPVPNVPLCSCGREPLEGDPRLAAALGVEVGG